ncbi:TspO/MBR family protein [Phreatobacter sp.]|uniref:TspO/MBR family protein n=1 Tax=Phreatobacter sp. TaxID=1966341 RepID=UPI003F72C3CB
MMDALAQGWLPIFLAVAGTLAVAVLGGMLTVIGPWYRSLRFPGWKPPDWVFGPIWTVILTLAAIAIVLAWFGASTPLQKSLVIGLFALNGSLNVAWNYLFFTLRRPDLALAEVGLLWLSILALILVLLPISSGASLLLVPYLVWVGIAALLNYRIVQLNGPFTRASG